MYKVRDGVIGHAIGDAMGVPLEFCSREELLKQPVTYMIKSSSNKIPEGSWSDDTTMEICLMKSFIDKGRFDYDDVMNNFIKWIEKGEFTPTGVVFDIGRTCLRAINSYYQGKTTATLSGLDSPNYNGNGSLMRILPVAYYAYYKELNFDQIYQLVKDVSSLTHRHEVSILGCYIYVNYIINLLNGFDKLVSYRMLRNINYSYFSKEALNTYIRVFDGRLEKVSINSIKSTGYVVDTLEAALWVILKANSFSEAIIGSINLGNDTDTVGAVTGSMAGIIYGYDSIPKVWLNKLQRREYLEDLANQFENKIK